MAGKATAYEKIRTLSKKGYDVFVNLCDSGPEGGNAGIEVTEYLEYFNLPFTGPNSTFYDPSKQVRTRTMKCDYSHFVIVVRYKYKLEPSFAPRKFHYNK